LLRMT
jgi:hypothetical protein